MIRTAPKPQRVLSTSDLEKDLDRLFSLIRRIEIPYCVLCGSIYRLENGHFWARFLRPTRWHPSNCWPLCARCNSRHEYKPEPFRDFLLETLGEREFHDLGNLAHSSTVFRYDELLEMREQFRNRLKELRAA